MCVIMSAKDELCPFTMDPRNGSDLKTYVTETSYSRQGTVCQHPLRGFTEVRTEVGTRRIRDRDEIGDFFE